MARVYSEEHRIFQESIRRFVDKAILPELDAWERDKYFPNKVFAQLGSQGFLGILVDDEWGGIGGDYRMAGAWCEEFGRVPSVGLTVAVHMHSVVVSAAMNRLGTLEMKQKWLPDAVAGEKIGAYAFTEPGAGSDLSRIQTKAVLNGDDYVINGSKTFITNGARAHFVLVLTRTGPEKGYDGFTTFVVDTSMPGFSVARKLDKLGWHSSDTAELTLTDVRVPKSAILGELNKGWIHAMESLEWERMMLALNALGGARACLQQTVQYVNDRKVFGRTVGQFDHSRELLAGLWSRLESATAYCHHGLELLMAGRRCRREISLAKLFSCELAIEVADRCLQLHGGYGYTTEFLPERWLRDLRLNTIGGGTSEIMASVAAKEMGL